MTKEKQRAIELGRKHIGEQRARIERQRALIDELEKGGSASALMVRSARQHLKEMLDSLDRMFAEFRSLQPELFSQDAK